jgi:hypothetical protein
MARHIGILALTAFTVGLISCSFKANAEVEETDRILEAIGPKIVELRKCYVEETFILDDDCKPESDVVRVALDFCHISHDHILRTAIHEVAPSMKKSAVDRLLSDLRDRARVRMESQIAQNREQRPTPCLRFQR